jgi:hypothetical protein
VPLADAFRAHRAMQLGAQAEQTPAPPHAVDPAELETRGTTPPPPAAEPTPQRRGPHADRLDKARQAQTEAMRPKPQKSKPAKPRDPFEEEDQ